MRNHQVAKAAIISVVAAIVGVVIALAIEWFPENASTQATEIDRLWDILIVVSVPIFVFVTGFLLLTIVRFRVKPGEEDKDGEPIHGNTKLEVVWTTIPAALIIGLCVLAYVVLIEMEEEKPNTLTVNVTAQQFAWSYDYPQGKGKKSIKSGVLYLPKDRPVKFDIKAKDVLHDFWVPEFRMKKDAVPGITTSYRVTPTKTGTFPVVCAELCGLGHTTMRSTVRVVEPEQFERWMKLKASGGSTAGKGGKIDGKAVFTSTETGCGGCHTLAAAGTNGETGPNLDDVLPGVSIAEIKKMIVDPAADTAKGYPAGLMPANYGQTLSPEELDALVEYLHESTE